MLPERIPNEVAADESGSAGDQNVNHVVTKCIGKGLVSSATTAKGTQEVRETADTGEREGQVESSILGDEEARISAGKTKRLIFHRDAAALRVVERDPSLLDEAVTSEIVIEDERASQLPTAGLGRDRAVDVIVGGTYRGDTEVLLGPGDAALRVGGIEAAAKRQSLQLALIDRCVVLHPEIGRDVAGRHGTNVQRHRRIVIGRTEIVGQPVGWIVLAGNRIRVIRLLKRDDDELT